MVRVDDSFLASYNSTAHQLELRIARYWDCSSVGDGIYGVSWQVVFCDHSRTLVWKYTLIDFLGDERDKVSSYEEEEVMMVFITIIYRCISFACWKSLLKFKPIMQVGCFPIVKETSLMQVMELSPTRVWPGLQFTFTNVPTITGKVLVVVMSDRAVGSSVHVSAEIIYWSSKVSWFEKESVFFKVRHWVKKIL